jgi:hypothetical protein
VLAKKFVKDSFTIPELSCEFPQISHTILYEIITVTIGYHKFCIRWVPKALTGAHKMYICTVPRGGSGVHNFTTKTYD